MSSPNPEVRAEYLHAFCVAARLGSISAAARSLGISQPAVSRSLLLLQRIHGAPLYRRRGAGIELTPAGSALLPHACAASESLMRARKFLSGELKTGGTNLRIGLSHHLTTRFTGPLLRAVRKFNDEGNLLRLHLLEAYSDDLLEALQSGTIDAAYLLEEPATRPDRQAGAGPGEMRDGQRGTERAMLLVKNDDPVGARAQAPMSVLEGETLIVPSFASTMYRRVLDALESAGVQPGRRIEVSGPAALRSAVLDGLGIGITIESFVRPEVAAGTLRLIAINTPHALMNVLFTSRDGSFLLPAEREALAFLDRQIVDWSGAAS